MTMDVEKEIAAANRRVQRQIDRDSRAALIRIGVDPDAEALASYIESMTALAVAFGEALASLGEMAATTIRTVAEALDGLKEEAT
jgi:hypothetical protein